MTMATFQNQYNFICEICDYKCFKKSDYKKHILTRKHKSVTEMASLVTQTSNSSEKYVCNMCNKIYLSRNGLWCHKKKCIPDNNFEKEDDHKMHVVKDTVNTDVFFEILKQNQDFKDLIVEQNKQLLEQNKQIIELSNKNSFITNNNNINSHNKTFNLQVFLNEKCKDALNIDEFIDSLKISFSDLENFGEKGFVDGVSRIFVNGLKSLDIYKRPIHCSDLKRETMHLKEQNVWEKDNANKDGLKKAVKLIAHKNMLKVNDWKQLYPQYKDSDSKKNDQYLKILVGAAGPYSNDDEDVCYNKIIRNVAKEVTIDKNNVL